MTTNGRTTTRRSILKGAGTSALAVAASGALRFPARAQSAPAIPSKTLRLSMVGYPNHTYPIIAMRNGWFDEVGISIEPSDGKVIFEPQAVPQLRNNEVDISSIYVGLITPAIDKIDDIKPIVLTSYWAGNTILTPPDSGFKTVDDFVDSGMSFADAARAAMVQLQGQEITVPPTQSTRPWLELAYSYGGLTLADSDLVVLEDPAAVQLGMSGRVKFAAPAGAAQIFQLQRQAGWRPVMSTSQMVKYSAGDPGAAIISVLNYDGFATTQRYLDEEHDSVLRFASVLFRTMNEIFGDNGTEALSVQVPFINAAAGVDLDPDALKFIFSEVGIMYPWERQDQFWTDTSSTLFYETIYNYQIEKFIAAGTIADQDYDLDAVFRSAALYQEMKALEVRAKDLAAQADAAELSEERRAMVDEGKAWIAKYNFLDAVRFLEAAIA